MRFLLDESAEVKIAAFLRSLGHDVKVTQHDFAVGLPDNEILLIAHAESRVLITNDSDFGELVFLLRMPHAGVIYFRFPDDSTAAQKIAALQRVLSDRPFDFGRFLVLTPGGVRVGGERE